MPTSIRLHSVLSRNFSRLYCKNPPTPHVVLEYKTMDEIQKQKEKALQKQWKEGEGKGYKKK
jgi:Trm5-related predicted tRNA methylase